MQPRTHRLSIISSALAFAFSISQFPISAQADDVKAPADNASPVAGNTDADASVGNTLSTVTVTGQKTTPVLPTRPVSSVYGVDAPVVDIPRTVSEINAEQLENDVIKNADDLVKYAPGITRGGGQNVSLAPNIRGQGSEIFQDGQRAYNVRHPFNVNAYEGVDIVAGPPTEVFGPATRSGGYANYLAKKPDFDERHTQISGQFGVWAPDGQSYHDNRLTIDTTGPINDQWAYRFSATPQRADDYYSGVRNNFNSVFGAVAWKPNSDVRVDWNASYDNYYDFNVTHGWNRVTQALVDNGQYYAGRATPIISVGSGANTRYYSPVFSSGAYNSSVIGWQLRTPNSHNQYIAGPLLTAAQLPSFLTNPKTPGTVRGWVYDPKLAGNGLVDLSRSDFSNPNDENTAKRRTTQLRVALDLSPTWSLLNSTFLEKSNDTGSSVGSFFTNFNDLIVDDRLELKGKHKFDLGGLSVADNSDSGLSFRRESFATRAANNSFTINPYDLTAPLNLKTPGTLLGLASPGDSGSWLGTPAVPQYSSAFGYLSLPKMYAIGDGFYSEAGGSPAQGGAVYTGEGHWTNTAIFTQHNFLVNDRYGLNVGFNGTYLDAAITNPVAPTPAQNYSDHQHFWLPSYQASAYYKTTPASSVYVTYDHSYAINTGGFADVLTWAGSGNKLNPLNFKSLSNLAEVGAKAELIPGRLLVSLAAYNQKRDQSPLSDGSVPRLEVNGIDASLRYQATQDLSSGVNVSKIKGKYTYISFPSGFFSPNGFVADNSTVFADGNALNKDTAPGSADAPGLPTYSVSAFGNYWFNAHWGVQVSGWWTSNWYTSLNKAVTVPAEYNIDTTLYYREKTWDVSLTVQNITNQKNYSNLLSGPTTEFLQPRTPIGLEAGFNYRF